MASAFHLSECLALRQNEPLHIGCNMEPTFSGQTAIAALRSCQRKADLIAALERAAPAGLPTVQAMKGIPAVVLFRLEWVALTCTRLCPFIYIYSI